MAFIEIRFLKPPRDTLLPLDSRFLSRQGVLKPTSDRIRSQTLLRRGSPLEDMIARMFVIIHYEIVIFANSHQAPYMLR
jgi:hypothetical protein